MDGFRISSSERIFSPSELVRSLPLDESGKAFIQRSRDSIKAILRGDDPRILAVVGPCSIHDSTAALEYAQKLFELSEKLGDVFFFVMRCYFEKPRTVEGWKGLVNDPDMDNSFDIRKGLETARKFLLKLAEIGIPAGTEALDTLALLYYQDLVSWNCIGARTCESQIHRNLASMLSTAVGFKNPTSGDLRVAANSLRAASEPAGFLWMGLDGMVRAVRTEGNKCCHMILRGTDDEPNYGPKSVALAARLCEEEGIDPAIMIDCSHGNSSKDPSLQSDVIESVTDQILAGDKAIRGLMMESFLESGAQKPGRDMKYGVSVTDPCLGWDDTKRLLCAAHDRLSRRFS